MAAWTAQAITAAANLGIADALANGPLSADQLARAVNADADALSRLLRALITRGIFRQRRDGRYELTPLAATLRSDGDVSLNAWGVVAGYDFSRYATIVDVGGGHGRLLAAIVDATPNSRGILFDLPHVVAGATVVLEEHRVADRVRITEGSFFDAVPDGGDAYVLKNVIHDWADDDAVRILRNVRKAAAAGKSVLLVEAVIPEHNREYPGKWVDLEMLLVAGARERTAIEYGRLLSRAGFRMTRVVDTASPFSVVEATAI